MNELIDTIFGDVYITLKCESGECLHYSQVPGYVVRSLVTSYWESWCSLPYRVRLDLTTPVGSRSAQRRPS